MVRNRERVVRELPYFEPTWESFPRHEEPISSRSSRSWELSRCAILRCDGIDSIAQLRKSRSFRVLSTYLYVSSCHLRSILPEERGKTRVATLKTPKRPSIRFERNSDDPVVRPRCRPRARAHTGAHNCTHVQLVHISQSFHSRRTLLGHIKSATHDSSRLACIDSTLCTLLHTILPPPLPLLRSLSLSFSLSCLLLFFFFSVLRCYQDSEAQYDCAFFCPELSARSLFRLIVKIYSPVYFLLPSYLPCALSVFRKGSSKFLGSVSAGAFAHTIRRSPKDITTLAFAVWCSLPFSLFLVLYRMLVCSPLSWSHDRFLLWCRKCRFNGCWDSIFAVGANATTFHISRPTSHRCSNSPSA